MFVRNAWYPAAWLAELGTAPLARRILGERVVLFRGEDGAAAALEDRCPHRHAPLSMGQVRAGAIECPYHGMTFDRTGACRRIPGQGRIPVTARARVFPTTERYGLVFVWTGDPELADPASIRPVPQFGRDGWGLSKGYTRFGSNYLNILDNLVDPAHTSFVHASSIGNAAAEEVPVETRVEERTVTVQRWIDAAPPPPVIRRYTGIDTPLDRWQIYHLEAPGTSWVDFGAFAPGSPRDEASRDAAPYRVLSYAFLAPETERSTHYFWFQLRNFAADRPETTAEFERLYAAVFEEDRLLLEAIQAIEDEDPDRRPLRIASDSGVVRLRQIIAELLNAESDEGRSDGVTSARRSSTGASGTPRPG